MPVMRWRVVCALRDVILTFWPTSAFMSVDLPTFGRPTIATMPQRKPGEVGAFVMVVCSVDSGGRGLGRDGRCANVVPSVARIRRARDAASRCFHAGVAADFSVRSGRGVGRGVVGCAR